MLIVTDPATDAARRLVSVELIESTLGVSELTAESLADAATALIERYCDRVFAEQGYEERLPGNGTAVLRLSAFPVISVASVKVNGEDEEEYTLDAVRGWLYTKEGVWRDSFTMARIIELTPVFRANPTPNIVVEYRAGYAEIPVDLQRAALMLAQTIHKQQHVNGALSSESIGDWSYSVDTRGVMASVEPFLASYRVLT